MKKTKKNWLKRGLTMVLACVMCLGMCNIGTLSVLAADSQTSIEDGIYKVQVDLWNASMNQASMGNAAVRGSSTYQSKEPEDDYQPILVVEDGKGTLILDTMPITYAGMLGFLYELDAITNITYNEYNMPLTYDKLPTVELTNWKRTDGGVVYDTFNNEESSQYDRRTNGNAYPHTIAIPVELPEKAVTAVWSKTPYIHVYVPVMGALGSGDQVAHLWIDYSNMEKINDTSREVEYWLYEALSTEQGEASDEAWNVLQTTIGQVQERLSNIVVSVSGTTSVDLETQEMSDAERTECTKALYDAITAVKQYNGGNSADVWDGTSVAEPALDKMTGSYQISNGAELAWFAQQILAGHKSYNAVLVNDIDMGGHEWAGIGSYYKSFEGVFDGNGHTIKRLYMNVKDPGDDLMSGWYGLFNFAYKAEVKDLTVEGQIEAAESTVLSCGGIIGRADHVSVSNCVSKVQLDLGTSKTSGGAGGITASSYNSTYENCFYYGEINSGYVNVGGIVGSSTADTLVQCGNHGKITGYSEVGGIVGVYKIDKSSSDNSGISFCYNRGTVTGAYTDIGGIVGIVKRPTAAIETDVDEVLFAGLYNAGAVSTTGTSNVAKWRVGGIAGRLQSCDEDITGPVTVVKGGYTVGGTIVGTIEDNVHLAHLYTSGTDIYGTIEISEYSPVIDGNTFAGKTEEEMIAGDFCQILNKVSDSKEYFAPDEGINNGYPILMFQAAPKADYTAVDEALGRIPEDIDSGNYIEETVQAVKDAQDKVVRDKKAAEQAEVDAMAQAINAAVDALELKDADYGAVDAALAKIPEDLRLYTDETVQAVNTAKAAVVRDKKITEQDKVNTMAQDIEQAVAKLAYRPADYTAVYAAIEKANALDRTQYANYSAVEAALNAVVEGKKITEQEAVNKMAQDIEDAIAALEYNPADYEVVKQALAAIPEDLTIYTQETADAVDAAKEAVAYGKNITEQAEVNAMAQAIQDAVNALVRIADYSAVDAAIAEIPEDLSLYTDETAQAVNEAVKAVVRGKGTPEQDTVDGYAQAIRDAVSKLTYRAADYTAVDAAVNKAEALKDICKDYSKVQEAIDAVNRDKNIIEQSEVDVMAQAIEEAIAALEYNDADYSAVDAALEKVNALDKSKYKDFSGVEQAVNAVVRGKDVTEQAEVDAMAKAIEEAIAALEEKGEGTGSGGSLNGGISGNLNSGISGSSNSGISGSSGQKTAKTGDTANVMIWGAAALIAAAAIGAAGVRKRKRME